ncbi:LysM peptidoglycan-binding domain-containing protein [Aliiroseovarius sp. Z3]|uniref:LysM peptidoglycan-binding domain-containing protein n=1 Tax=Aliiroseovarius sp. Z3 TaxID=2811402 RepID=UPI0023B2CC1A|nr:LysM peptidoglycan-binding domain-containing protein [Aliiroseovarius sp. Z3]MDE9450662.1 LysM peptidoglycan-binding domain-containing protein [Aliiroseovarius sp. Z3]
MTTETGNDGNATGLKVAAGAVLVVAIGAVWYLWSQTQSPSESNASSTSEPVATIPVPPEDATKADVPQADSATAPPEDVADSAADELPPSDTSPGFDVVRVDPDGSAVVAGHAEPGSTIQLTLDGAPLEDVEVGSDGNFVALLDLPVETPGALGFLALDDGGEVIENSESSQTVLIAPTVSVPTTSAPASEPAADAPQTDTLAVADTDPPTPPSTETSETTANAPQILLADDEGISVLQDGTGRPAVDNVVIDAITYDETGEVALSGRGQGGANLRVYLDNKPIEIGEVTESGQWRVPLPEVDSGVYTLRVDELAEDGSVTSRTETPFKREEPTQLAAVANTDTATPNVRVEAVTVQPGSTLWAIAREHLGEGPLYVRVFAANREQIRDPDLIYPGQVFAIPDAE